MEDFDVRQELEAIAKISQGKSEGLLGYKKRLALKVDAVVEEQPSLWEALSMEARTWVNNIARAFQDPTGTTPYPDFPRPHKILRKHQNVVIKPGKKESNYKNSAVKAIYRMVILNPEMSLAEIKQRLIESKLYATDQTIKTKRNDIRTVIKMMIIEGRYKIPDEKAFRGE